MDISNLWTIVWKSTFDGAEDRKYKVEKLCCLIDGNSPYKVPVIRGGNTFNLNIDDLAKLQDSDMIIGYDEPTKQNYLVSGSMVPKDTGFLEKPLDIVQVHDERIGGMFPYKGYKAVLTIGSAIYTLDDDDGLVLVDDLTSGLSIYGADISNMFEYNGTYYVIVNPSSFSHSILSSVDLVSWDYIGSTDKFQNAINIFHVQEYDGKLQFTLENFRDKLVVYTYDGLGLTEKFATETSTNSIMRGNNVLCQPKTTDSTSIWELTPDGTLTELAKNDSGGSSFGTIRGIAPITGDTYLINTTDTFTYPNTMNRRVYDYKPQEGVCGGVVTPELKYSIVRMGDSDKYFWNLDRYSHAISDLTASVLDGTDHLFFAGEGSVKKYFNFGYMFDNNKFYIGCCQSTGLFRIDIAID